MAPELMSFTHATSYAADVYSFGVVLHHIITGEEPDRLKVLRGPRHGPAMHSLLWPCNTLILIPAAGTEVGQLLRFSYAAVCVMFVSCLNTENQHTVYMLHHAWPRGSHLARNQTFCHAGEKVCFLSKYNHRLSYDLPLFFRLPMGRHGSQGA